MVFRQTFTRLVRMRVVFYVEMETIYPAVEKTEKKIDER